MKHCYVTVLLYLPIYILWLSIISLVNIFGLEPFLLVSYVFGHVDLFYPKNKLLHGCLAQDEIQHGFFYSLQGAIDIK